APLRGTRTSGGIARGEVSGAKCRLLPREFRGSVRECRAVSRALAAKKRHLAPAWLDRYYYYLGNAQFIGRFERRATSAANNGTAVTAGEWVGNLGGALRTVK